MSAHTNATMTKVTRFLNQNQSIVAIICDCLMVGTQGGSWDAEKPNEY